MALNILVLNIGLCACACAVIMIKASTEHVVLLAAYRQLVAALVLAPLFWRDLRRYRNEYTWSTLVKSCGAGVVLGLHFITWNIGARMTLAANSSLIVNMVPVVMPFLVFLLFKEIVSRGEVTGTIIALMGVLLLGTADFRLGPETFGGDIMCFVSMVLFALYLALGRKYRTIKSIWLYIVPLYFTGGVFCLMVSPVLVRPFRLYTPGNLGYILGLGIIPVLRGQVVAIANLGQFIYAGVMAYYWLNEIPSILFYISAFLIVSGAIIAIRFSIINRLT
jgi:drug/metabolite transporter (DMT)-like permease